MAAGKASVRVGRPKRVGGQWVVTFVYCFPGVSPRYVPRAFATEQEARAAAAEETEPPPRSSGAVGER
ncbi:hypothetical protein [Gemmata sp.]|uniref:hypothetical protein n=1 Tax=Gemmata sp. TaxID=1914242 RepID=UPI003F6ED36E